MGNSRSTAGRYWRSYSGGLEPVEDIIDTSKHYLNNQRMEFCKSLKQNSRNHWSFYVMCMLFVFVFVRACVCVFLCVRVWVRVCPMVVLPEPEAGTIYPEIWLVSLPTCVLPLPTGWGRPWQVLTRSRCSDTRPRSLGHRWWWRNGAEGQSPSAVRVVCKVRKINGDLDLSLPLKRNIMV